MDGGFLPSVRAYLDFQEYRVLPHAGGIRDQRISTMRDLRIISAVVAKERALLTPKR